MAPTKAQKRAAADATKTTVPAKKGRLQGAEPIEDPAVTALIEFVQTQDNLPESARNMLAIGIRGSLGTSKSERHKVQSAFVDMVEEVVRTRELVLLEAIETAKAAEAAGEAARAKLAADVAAKETVLGQKNQKFEETMAANSAALEQVSVAKACLVEKEDAQKSGDVAFEEAKANKAAVADAMEKDMKCVLQGECDGKDLVALLSKLKFDDSLILALPGTCAKTPSDRGPFDTMVLNQLETSLAAKLTELTTAVEGETAAAAQRAQGVTDAKEALQAAETAQDKTAKEQNDAETARDATSSEVEAATAALAAHEPEERRLQADREAKIASAEEFKTQTRMPFEQLRDSSAQAMVDVTIAEPKIAAAPEVTEAASVVGGA